MRVKRNDKFIQDGINFWLNHSSRNCLPKSRASKEDMKRAITHATAGLFQSAKYPWITTCRTCQSSSRFLGCWFSLVLDFASLPPGTLVDRQPRACRHRPGERERGYPVRAKRIGALRATRRAQTHSMRAFPTVSHSSPCIHGEERRPTTYRGEEREREILPGKPP